MAKGIRILAPVGYPWEFTGPRIRDYETMRRKFIPFDRLRRGWDGFTIFNPIDVVRCDLIHAFNRIPLNGPPYVIGFESHLPRTFSPDGKYYKSYLYKKLLSEKCRRIVAISNFARQNFVAGLHADRLPEQERELLISKTTTRYPNLRLDTWAPPKFQGGPDVLELTFVGNHFGRKGGCVAARIAELAHENKLPLRVNIVSKLQMGGAIWTDPVDGRVLERFVKMLKLPNVRYYPTLPNRDVLALFDRSHLSLLTTFSDTFGFSVIESMSRGTPALCTAQGALPEFVSDKINGLMIAPALTPGLSHWGPETEDRKTPEFEKLYLDEIERMAIESVRKIEVIFNDYQGYVAMRAAARNTCKRLFDARDAAEFWNDIYRTALACPGKYSTLVPAGVEKR
ncbi:glycosyltransferase family 4 protein [Rhizobium sp. NXC24]|uniref:glycosyltransferase family 4 protein n=1 Tax=Rhizobium sp. NXC24 TaxID=2048897 RepID=UPI000CDF51B2|nr:glycosyltransferase family 4 protein [Rhizobium sp. NXC24]AVA25826.1 glycosyltransferase family 1 protein [Rhizobium sp. NXC24]